MRFHTFLLLILHLLTNVVIGERETGVRLGRTYVRHLTRRTGKKNPSPLKTRPPAITSHTIEAGVPKRGSQLGSEGTLQTSAEARAASASSARLLKSSGSSQRISELQAVPVLSTSPGLSSSPPRPEVTVAKPARLSELVSEALTKEKARQVAKEWWSSNTVPPKTSQNSPLPPTSDSVYSLPRESRARKVQNWLEHNEFSKSPDPQPGPSMQQGSRMVSPAISRAGSASVSGKTSDLEKLRMERE